MKLNIRRAAVLGAGTMGTQIAALLAASGITTHLLDLSSEGERSSRALAAIANLKQLKPTPLYNEASLSRLIPGNFDDDMKVLEDCDWILEAVVERLDIKQSLHRKIAQYARPNVPVTTNTSGIKLVDIAAEFSPEQRQRFFGTHFFNPPRYMKLLEIIPHPETNLELLNAFEAWSEERLGKGIVRARDTVNFIANRIGTFCSQSVLRAMDDLGLNVETVDSLTGPLIGRPKSATLRTADVVGLDIGAAVALNNYEKAPDDPYRDWFLPKPWLANLIERGHLGQKTGSVGIYKKDKDASGNTLILAYRPATQSYETQNPTVFPWSEEAAKERDLVKRIKLILKHDDPGAQMVWRNLRDIFSYSAYLVQDIADGLVQPVDDAMRWGYSWAMGPFELWQALGYDEVLARMQQDKDKDGLKIASWLREGMAFYSPMPASREWLAAGGPRTQLQVSSRGTANREIPQASYRFSLPTFENKSDSRVIMSNPSASLVDIGDGVACLAFHSKMNTVNTDISSLIEKSVEKVGKEFQALLIANDAANFSAGADIRDFLGAMASKNWDVIDQGEIRFQGILSQLKFAPFPVVSCPTGLTLGGGCEVTLHTSHQILAAETSAGLVEVGVGLLPAGGGTKELAIRAYELASQGENADPMPFLRRAFQLIFTARRSSSGFEAVEMGLYAAANTDVSLSREHLIEKAKRQALTMAANGFIPKTPQNKIRVVGKRGLAVFKDGLQSLVASQKISAYDAFIGERIATIFCGGDVPEGTLVSEQTFFDLERTLFVELCQQPQTTDRIQHMLKTGKPLRN